MFVEATAFEHLIKPMLFEAKASEHLKYNLSFEAKSSENIMMCFEANTSEKRKKC